MIPSLAALVTLQSLDSSIDQARKRLAELPGLEQTIAARIAAAQAGLDAAKAALQENVTARRQLEKDVAAVDTRLARFDDHKASVKTNHEYTALLHEIATAKAEKDAIEERILGLMEQADALGIDVKSAEAARKKAADDGDTTRIAIVAERKVIEGEVAQLVAERTRHAAAVDARSLATYEQLRKGRRGVAVAQMINSGCAACHVRLRPAIEQQVRRNDGLIQCDSCQRILYAPAPPDPAGSAGTAGDSSAAARNV
jgi:predicted  nucleic acid-binding Zn-ribbon protein